LASSLCTDHSYWEHYNLLGVKYIIIKSSGHMQNNCSGRSDLNSSLSVSTNEPLYLLVIWPLVAWQATASPPYLDLNHFSGVLPLKSELLVAKAQRFPMDVSGALQRRPACGTRGTHGSRAACAYAPSCLFRSVHEVRRNLSLCREKNIKYGAQVQHHTRGSASWLCWFANTTVYHSKLKFKLYKQMQRLGFCSMLGNQSARLVQSLAAFRCCSYKYSAHPQKMVRKKQ
jgi:hypothetical protein